MLQIWSTHWKIKFNDSQWQPFWIFTHQKLCLHFWEGHFLLFSYSYLKEHKNSWETNLSAWKAFILVLNEKSYEFQNSWARNWWPSWIWRSKSSQIVKLVSNINSLTPKTLKMMYYAAILVNSLKNKISW